MKKIQTFLFVTLVFAAITNGSIALSSPEKHKSTVNTNLIIQKLGALIGAAVPATFIRIMGREAFANPLFYMSSIPSLANLFFKPHNKLARLSGVLKVLTAYIIGIRKNSVLMISLTLSEIVSAYCTLFNDHATKTVNKILSALKKSISRKNGR